VQGVHGSQSAAHCLRSSWPVPFDRAAVIRTPLSRNVRVRLRDNQRPPRRSETSLATSFRLSGFMPLEAILSAILRRSRPSGDTAAPLPAPCFGAVVAVLRFTTLMIVRRQADIESRPVVTNDNRAYPEVIEFQIHPGCGCVRWRRVARGEARSGSRCRRWEA
jgi:hypothetical protein